MKEVKEPDREKKKRKRKRLENWREIGMEKEN